VNFSLINFCENCGYAIYLVDEKIVVSILDRRPIGVVDQLEVGQGPGGRTLLLFRFVPRAMLKRESQVNLKR
jgi:hypothetical protein